MPAVLLGALDLALDALPPEPEGEPGAVKVRMLLAVTAADQYVAYHSCNISDEELLDMAALDCPEARLTWVEAHVPLPTPESVETVQGEVADAE